MVGWLMGSVWLGMAQAENRALFIGIDDYQSPDIHKLRGAVSDARRMQQFAQRRGIALSKRGCYSITRRLGPVSSRPCAPG